MWALTSVRFFNAPYIKSKTRYDRYFGKRDRQNQFFRATAMTALGTLETVIIKMILFFSNTGGNTMVLLFK
jgi:hypothetical protein